MSAFEESLCFAATLIRDDSSLSLSRQLPNGSSRYRPLPPTCSLGRQVTPSSSNVWPSPAISGQSFSH